MTIFICSFLYLQFVFIVIKGLVKWVFYQSNTNRSANIQKFVEFEFVSVINWNSQLNIFSIFLRRDNNVFNHWSQKWLYDPCSYFKRLCSETLQIWILKIHNFRKSKQVFWKIWSFKKNKRKVKANDLFSNSSETQNGN